MTNPNIPPEIADATPAPAPVRMVNIRAATLEQLHAAVACASEANYTSSADMRIRWGLSEGRCVIEEVQRLCYDALHALESENQEVTEQVRVSRQDQPRPEAQEQEDQAMTKLTKAERADILSASSADGYYAHDISRLCADLDAAEAERDEIKTALGVMGATRERALEVAGSQDELEERIDSMSRERDVALKGWSAAEAARDDAAAQRDRAESERDALKAQEGEWADQIAAALNSTADKLGRTPSMIAGHVRREHEAHTACFDRLRKAVDERDALKAKLDDPRRVVIHETEVVATKEEIATLKTRLADLSEADEELHTCRALVNATSENLSVDLERMVDDLAEANEKAARSEKDSHSWHDLYEDTKAKLAALANAAEVVAENYEECAGFGELDCLAPLYAAIAAARGGATQ